MANKSTNSTTALEMLHLKWFTVQVSSTVISKLVLDVLIDLFF